MKVRSGKLGRREFLQSAALVASLAPLRAATPPPNIIVIFADDLGYGDLSCYGSRIQTPSLDRMAAEGVRFTDFYAASSVCSPSRASLMTGRYAPRTAVPRVLSAGEPDGLPVTETTMAQMLKGAGYATACVGKWHLGSQPAFMPTQRGFDEYFGIPYSHDMWPRPLVLNGDVVEQPAEISTLTQRYTAYARDFIARSKDTPFFLYLAHSMPHIPLAVSPDFAGRSGHGLYGDAVQELDWSVGRILETLKQYGLDNNTLVLFSSDNGPWYQGSPGRLRGRKGDSYEGGFRVPFIARFPGRIPQARTVNTMATALDVFPTVSRLTGAPLPDNPLDGIDIWPLLTGAAMEPRTEPFLFFNDIYLQCARLGPWKVHFARYNVPMFNPMPVSGRKNLPLPRLELYNVVEEPEEAYDRAPRNAVIVQDIVERTERMLAMFPPSVMHSYNETKKCQVEDTPADALPLEKP